MTCSKAEIERRRRARMNASLDQLKMFHLIKSPKIESKLEKIEILDLTIKYLRSVGNDQRQGAEKMAYTGFKDGFQAAQKVITSFIYNRCHSSVSSPLVASINAELASVFDQSFKSMNWLRFVYGNDDKGREQSSSANTPKMNLSQFGRQSANFISQLHSTPIFHSYSIPPSFESPESAYSNQSLSQSLSLSTSSTSAKGSDESLNESNNTTEFVCVTCEENCLCDKK
ncbi:helix-loop-helix DNA-binding domain-containing protein [Loa loa]|uniref:Helix-loop-helix DNA-binding domain-containing protein n=1 Tax=Loa loa TaxID=7209 RepID=A0A1S0U5G6_LOALO|nr:helix-loop-helix DNA-binding domain-containing protein [Loa loa]EFO25289.1 helix-loop-helix DNA-binding domain-containing protein [Loa loa]